MLYGAFVTGVCLEDGSVGSDSLLTLVRNSPNSYTPPTPAMYKGFRSYTSLLKLVLMCHICLFRRLLGQQTAGEAGRLILRGSSCRESHSGAGIAANLADGTTDCEPLNLHMEVSLLLWRSLFSASMGGSIRVLETL